MENETLIGVDIGGTKISAGLVTDGLVREKNRFENPANQSIDAILGKVIEAIEDVFIPEVAGIGIGTPGLVDAESGIVMEVRNIPALKDFPLQAKLKAHFNRPVFLNNDANCYAVGEKYFGQGQDYDNIVAITLGTGLGTGLILNGSLYNGKHGGAGEFGYLKYKGKNLEYYCASQFFKSEYNTDSLTLSQAANTGDPAALKIFDEYGHHLGQAMLSVMCSLDPDIIILGGSISHAFPLFKAGMYAVIRNYPVVKVAEGLQVVVGSLTDSAILGAAALFYDGIRK